MARVKNDSATTDARGRLGGSVISSNALGWYIKSFVPPYKSRSEAQSEARRVFLLANNAWANLSSGNVSAWKALAADPAYARLDWWGDPYQLSGHAFYLSVAVVQFGLSGTFPTSPPSAGLPAALPTMEFVVTSSEPGGEAKFRATAALDASIYQVRVAVSIQRGMTAGAVSTPPLLVGYFQLSGTAYRDIQTELEATIGLVPRASTLTFSAAAVSGEALVNPPNIYRVETAEP